MINTPILFVLQKYHVFLHNLETREFFSLVFSLKELMYKYFIPIINWNKKKYACCKNYIVARI